VKVPIFFHMGLYQRYWRFASLNEVRLIAGAALVGCVVQAALVFLLLMPLGWIAFVPRSVGVLEGLLTMVALGLPRFAVRLSNARVADRPAAGQCKRVLLVGAGNAGHMVLRELATNPQLGLIPVGIVDDDVEKQGLKIDACKVMGTTADIPDLVRRLKVDRVLITIPSAGGKKVREIMRICEQARVETMILPGVYELLSGRIDVQRMRKIQIEDLLRREPVETQRDQIEALVRGRRVLVTGGGGSIGSELCRQLALCHPQELIVLGHGENSLYHIGKELSATFRDLPLSLVVADVRDKDRLKQAFARFSPHIVFHAAAHKHVPLMEDNVEDAVTNNVLGTRNLLDVAAEAGVSHLVMISSDKAVNPTSMMGATKRLAEMLVQDAAHRTGRCFVAVRFGNVLGSRGSVVPLFQEQIARGGPITITHPDVCRYFMTIPEAVQLVLQAATLGRGGEVFFLDMGEPIRIVDLARDLVMLSGLEVGRDIDIEFVGLRPGEKLFEELSLDGEQYERSAHEKIYVCKNGQPWTMDDSADLHRRIEGLLGAARQGDARGVRRMVQQLVPEYAPPQHSPVACEPVGAMAASERASASGTAAAGLKAVHHADI
jgi:FlaA1/EpsC-like NDP-sugar epimerase